MLGKNSVNREAVWSVLSLAVTLAVSRLVRPRYKTTFRPDLPGTQDDAAKRPREAGPEMKENSTYGKAVHSDLKRRIGWAAV